MPKLIKPAGLDKDLNNRMESRMFLGMGDSKWNEVQHEIDHEITNGRKYWRTAALKDYLKRHTRVVKGTVEGTPRRVHPPKAPPPAPPPTRRRKAASREARP